VLYVADICGGGGGGFLIGGGSVNGTGEGLGGAG